MEPTFKFNPIPTDKFIEICRDDNGNFFAVTVDFLAVMQYVDDDGIAREDICFVQFDNFACFDVILPFKKKCTNHVAFTHRHVTYHDGQPVYHWDAKRLVFNHPEEGDMPD